MSHQSGRGSGRTPKDYLIVLLTRENKLFAEILDVKREINTHLEQHPDLKELVQVETQNQEIES